MAENLSKLVSAAKRLVRRLPAPLRGVRALWLLYSLLCLLLLYWTVRVALSGETVWATILGVITAATMVYSNVWMARRVINPIKGLNDIVRRIGNGSYGAKFEHSYEDELGDLTAGVNDISVRLGASERAHTDFVSSVSHELRTPLTAILGWGETLIDEDGLSERGQRGLSIICSEAARVSKMVEDLLEFTRISDGRFTLNMKETDLASEIREIAYSYNERLRHGASIVYEPPLEEMPLINGDKDRIRQVMLNLIDNAAKHGRGGDIELSMHKEFDRVCVTVRDHGPGVSEADLPRIKEKFFKGNTLERGSGIGLAISDEIVTRHGGELSIENAEGGGALVTVRFPVG